MKANVFTLLDFMNLEQFPHQELLTPCIDPKTVIIRHVSVIEAPIERFVRQGELVITTVLGFRDNETTFLRFVRSICSSGAAAVAVSFPEDQSGLVPPSVEAYAVSQGVPILRLPWKYRFSEITETVVERLRFAQAQNTAAWEAMQKKMLNAYLQHWDIQQAARILAGHLGAEILITDIGGRPIADTRQQQFPPDRPLSEGSLADYRLLLHINPQGQDVGCLYADRAHVTPQLLEETATCSSYVLTPLLLWFDREDISRNNRCRALNDFICGLASGTITPAADQLARARTLGIHLTHFFFCTAANLSVEGHELQSWLDDHELELIRLLTERGFAPMITVYKDHIIAYAEQGCKCMVLIDRLQHAINVTFPELNCVWGVSSENGSQDFGGLCSEALLASDLCRWEGGAGGIYRQQDTRLYQLLKSCLNDGDSRRRRDELIAPLLQYDSDNGTQLEKLLLCYFRCGGNVCRTAQTLHFHRQALRYRLKKIEELLGISLEDHERLLEVELSLRLSRFAKIHA
jgi:purine catabolism regulator